MNQALETLVALQMLSGTNRAGILRKRHAEHDLQRCSRVACVRHAAHDDSEYRDLLHQVGALPKIERVTKHSSVHSKMRRQG